MTRFRFLIAACAGTFLYVLVSLIGGRDGFWAQKQLQTQKRQISAHTASIQKVTDELQLEYLALKDDKDVISAYARKLGYVGPGEKLVKISGLAAKETQIFDPGTVVKHTPVKYVPESVCKMLGLVVFSLMYFVLFLSDYNKGIIQFKRKKNAKIEGMPIYDVR